MDGIEVTDQGDGTFRVTVTDGRSTSTHIVTVDPEESSGLPSGTSNKDLVKASFRFLLEREPKESIMSRFDLSVIGRFFPEYPGRINDYL